MAIGLAISGAALLLAVLHALFDVPRDDPLTLALLLVAAAPWLGRFVSSFKMGKDGVEIAFREIEDALSRAQTTLVDAARRGAPVVPAGPTDIGRRFEDEAAARAVEAIREAPDDAALELAGDDPKEVLIKLGFGVERRLRAMAAGRGSALADEDVRLASEDLVRREGLGEETTRALLDLVDLARRAARCQSPPPDALSMIQAKGRKVLRLLDEVAGRGEGASASRAPPGPPPGAEPAPWRTVSAGAVR